MNVRQLIALIRSQIAKLRSENAELVTIASLETLLAAVENHVAQQPDEPITAFEMEHVRLQHASNLAQYEARNTTALELLKSVITTADGRDQVPDLDQRWCGCCAADVHWSSGNDRKPRGIEH